ncbi:MAG: vitamin B12-dependent ribonucleotide reductase [Nanoarchaeota archaeon]|nr:vitamin B12-dependent ribonucleotide reductase [Nanoarchaeota archaeon]
MVEKNKMKMEGENKMSGLKMERRFSEGGSLYVDKVWEKGDASCGDFVQKGVTYPVGWSPLAVGIVSSKYFYGEKGTKQRENSVAGLVGRVAGSMGDWSASQGYFDRQGSEVFRDELEGIVLDQRAAFNSPVWFNVGIDRLNPEKSKGRKSSYVIGPRGSAIRIPEGKEYEYPQTAACFIQGVEDTMEGIMQLTTNEAMLFKYGSGTGTDLSTLRSSHEKLSGGGKPSGPLAYLKYMSRVAGIVRSGGKTRRAAKMDSLLAGHPEIKEFIECKTLEKRKAEALMTQGYSPEEAIETVAYQNANLSVRAGDDFMNAVLNDEEWQTVPVHSMELEGKTPKHKAKDLMNLISEGTKVCGDPGMQFHDTINRWHTCPNSGPINASNPCSEYMFVDDSACNLASLRLTKFLGEDGVFDVEAFGDVSRKMAFAQDVLVDKSSYPTKKIAENAHKFRPLGQGYADLGALLMTLGLPYDSEAGRATAAAITALQTATVYEASTEMAEKLGSFEEFEKNRESMLNVMGMHYAALDGIDRSVLPTGLENVLDEAYKSWDRVIDRGSKFGFRNAQATVLAPTGTIGFMMDCDTTGIEPDFALRKTKKLFDGGTMTIANQSVEPALKGLNYQEGEISDILKYIKDKGTIEGAPYFRDEDLPIFDCSGKGNGKRFISSNGHIDMMAAVQPFLSGAISKTVNLPKGATTDTITELYVDAWKKGLKAVAIYVDGSHVLQPLSSEGSGKGGLEKVVAKGPVAVRKKLPNERQSLTHKFNISGHEGYLTVGMYESGEPGEVFINMSKEGSTMGGLMDVIGTQMSIGLQYGVPMKTMVGKFMGQKFDPRGLVLEGNKDIKVASSIVDYIGQYLNKKFVEGKVVPNAKTIDNGEGSGDSDMDEGNSFFDWEHIPIGEQGGFCPLDGKMMRMVGHCREECQCGHTNTAGCGE